jgi:hypothetical protein
MSPGVAAGAGPPPAPPTIPTVHSGQTDRRLS